MPASRSTRPVPKALRSPHETAYEAAIERARQACNDWAAFYAGQSVQADRPPYRAGIYDGSKGGGDTERMHYAFRRTGSPSIELAFDRDQVTELRARSGTVKVDGYTVTRTGDVFEIVSGSTPLPTEHRDPSSAPLPYERLHSKALDPSAAQVAEWNTLTFREGGSIAARAILSDSQVRRLFDGERVTTAGLELFFDKGVVYCASVSRITASGKETRTPGPGPGDWPASVEQLDEIVGALPRYLQKIVKLQHLESWRPVEARVQAMACSKRKYTNRLREAYAVIGFALKNS